MTEKERHECEAKIKKFLAYTETRHVYENLLCIIDDWENYNEDGADVALGCLIGDEKRQARLLAHFLNEKTIREALQPAVVILIQKLNRKIDEI